MKQRFKAVFVAVVLCVGLIVGVQPALASQSVTCKSSFGTKVPVLMVHGWMSGPEMWSSGVSPLEKTLKQLEGLAVVDAFDYRDVHDQWVTNPAIGPKLALTIDCLAQASLKGGGKGKVIVVAHSMGGLATRFAARQTVNGRRVADELGLVVTLGTPNLGSLLANAGAELATAGCRQVQNTLTFNVVLGLFVTKEDCLLNFAIKGLSKGSKELSELAPFPPDVPVRAIAGDARVYMPLLFSEARLETNSDLVVGKESATAQSSKTNKGDGVFVFDCEMHLEHFQWQGNGCTHNELPKTSYIQESVRKGIEEYLASARVPAVPMTNFFGLQLPLSSDWEILKAPDDPFPNDRKLVIWKKGCDPQAFRTYCNGFVVAKMGGAEPKMPYKDGIDCNYDYVHDDLGWTPPKVIGPVTIGGVRGEHFTQQNVCKLEDGAKVDRKGDILHGWRFSSKGIIVYDSEGFKSSSPNPLPGLERLLQGASWS